MSDLVKIHIVGFPTRRLIWKSYPDELGRKTALLQLTCGSINAKKTNLAKTSIKINSFKPGVPFMGHRQTE